MKILFGGTPVTEGNVDAEPLSTEMGEEPSGGVLNSEGTVTLLDIPVGTYVISVKPPEGNIAPTDDGPAPPQPQYDSIPRKFRIGSTSPLRMGVSSDVTKFQFDLKE